MADQDVPVVFDNSNPQITKAGFAGEDRPRLVFPSIVARQRIHAVCNPPPLKDIWIGHEIDLAQNPLLTTAHPMSADGSIANPDDMEKLWQHAYKSLSVEPESQTLLVVDRCLFAQPPGKTREMMVQIAFETFWVPRLYVAHADVLEVCCRTETEGGTGLSVHSDGGFSSAVPVFGGVVLEHAAVRVNGDEGYALPDGNVVEAGGEGRSAVEELFGGGSGRPGIGGAVSAAVRKSDRHVRRDVVGNVVFSGGNTRIPGFQLRLEREVRCLFPNWNGSVRPPVDPDHSAWVAGSMLASLSTFKAMTITYAEYDETGPTMVHRKCF